LEQKKILLLLIIGQAGGPCTTLVEICQVLTRIWRSADRLYSGESYVSYCDQNLVQDVSDQAIILKKKIFEPYH
jgi:hypothetical protein